MKSIKIQPLTFTEDLNLKIGTQKNLGSIDINKHEEIMKLLNQYKGSDIIIGKALDNNEKPAVSTNFQTKDRQLFQFPEPNFVHLYFQNACNCLAKSQTILKELKKIESIHHSRQYDKFIEYFYEVSNGISSLVTSIEAFINQNIPEDYIYQVDESKQWNKSDIEWKDIKTKIKEIIPTISGKHFAETNQKEYSYILEIQGLRNNLVHLKTTYKINKTYYEDIIKKLLDFTPKKYVDAVFIYLNSLKADYIQENNDSSLD